MRPDRHLFPGRLPAALEYQGRIGVAWPGQAAGRRPLDPAAAAVRVAGATAATAVLGCLAVAVPCVVFAVVGYWFDDVSTVPAAQVAAAASAAAVVAAVPAVACHRLGRPRAVGRGFPAGNWN